MSSFEVKAINSNESGESLIKHTELQKEISKFESVNNNIYTWNVIGGPDADKFYFHRVNSYDVTSYRSYKQTSNIYDVNPYDIPEIYPWTDDNAGTLYFSEPLSVDFENPTDADKNNIYEIVIQGSDIDSSNKVIGKTNEHTVLIEIQNSKLEKYLTIGSPSNYDNFGHSFDVSNNLENIIVGMPEGGGSTGEAGSGDVYFYEKVDDKYELVQTFSGGHNTKNEWGISNGHYLGHSVAISANGEIFAFSAPSEKNDDGYGYGKVYTYKKVDDKFESIGEFENFAIERYKGNSIDLSNDGQTLVISSGYYPAKGFDYHLSIYSFENNSWVLETNFQLPHKTDVNLSDDGNLLVINSPNAWNWDKHIDKDNHGVVRTYIKESNNWQMIDERWGNPYEQYGSKVKISGNGKMMGVATYGGYYGYNTPKFEIFELVNNQWVEIKHNLNTPSSFAFSDNGQFLAFGYSGYKSSDPNFLGSRDGEGKLLIYSYQNKELKKIDEVFGESKQGLGSNIEFSSSNQEFIAFGNGYAVSNRNTLDWDFGYWGSNDLSSVPATINLFKIEGLEEVGVINSSYVKDSNGFSSVNNNAPITITNFEVGKETTLHYIKDYDGNSHAGDTSGGTASSYKYQGLLDVNGDGTFETIFTNKSSRRWVTAEVDSITGQIDFTDHGQGGTTRVVGIYIDPLVTSGHVVQGSDHDSQRRFQNDLKIDNLIAKHSGDYDSDGIHEVYWKTNDGTAYLRSLMHADGNIRYANYQSEAQMKEYLTDNGDDSVISDIV